MAGGLREERAHTRLAAPSDGVFAIAAVPFPTALVACSALMPGAGVATLTCCGLLAIFCTRVSCADTDSG